MGDRWTHSPWRSRPPQIQKQIREKYDIEGLWGDAELTVIPSSVTNL